LSKSQQPARGGATSRSQERRAELIAVGRRLFARTSYDALSIDDIAKQAGVAKGLIYYYFSSKRGYYLAVVEDSVEELVTRARSDPQLPARERLLDTLDGYLRFVQGHEAAYRTVVTGGVGFDTEVFAIRDRVRHELLTTIAEGAYGHADLAALPRTALTGWLSYVEGVTLNWLEHRDLGRESVRVLLAMMLRQTLDTIAQIDPEYPAPPTDPA
jgi:AcrR family transcriptional regulator